MMEQEILDKVIVLLKKYNKSGKVIDLETRLGADLNIDSVAAMDFIMEIEDEFDFDINVNQVGDLKNIGDLVQLIKKNTG